jgi:hypothetical protein
MMPPKQLICLCLTLCSFGAANSASAGPIIFFNEFRQVRVGATGATSTSQGHFLELFAVTDLGASRTASQDSLIGGGFAGGSGEVTAEDPLGNVVGAESTLFTGFELDQDYQAELNVDLSASGRSNAYASLINSNTGGAFVITSIVDTSETVSFFGILSAGRYELLIGADTLRDNPLGEPFAGSASFNGGLTLTALDAAPVPEPASMTMLALGLIGAGARRLRTARTKPAGA